MRKFSVLAAIFLILCAALILLMRSCGGDRSEKQPVATPEAALTLPTVAPESAPTPTPEPTPSYAGAIWTTDYVRLRRANSTESEIIAEVPPKTQLERTGLTGDGWSIVSYIGATCYVSSDYVTTTPPVELSVDPTTGGSGFNYTECNDTVWTTDGVNLRRGPGTSFEIGESLTEAGVELRRTRITDNNWSLVIYKNVGYYVINDYITTVQPTADPDAVAPPATEPPAVTTAAAGASAQGEFRSNTGVKLNVVTRWSAVSAGDGSWELTLNVYLLSCTLDNKTGSAADDVSIKVGNDTFNRTSGFTEVVSDTETETFLCTVTTTVSTVSVPVSVSWRFNGTYSGVKLDNIEAAETLVLSA